MSKNKPILYVSSTCIPCLNVLDFINVNNLDVELRWVMPRMNTKTAQKYFQTVKNQVTVGFLAGVPTLLDEKKIEGSTNILSYLKNKYKTL